MLPREKLLKNGVESLSNTELLAIFFRTGIKNCNVIQLSDQVLTTFGSLRKLFNTDLKEFCAIKGLGITKYVQLQASKEIVKRYLADELQTTESFTKLEHAKLFVQSILEQKEQEIFLVLFLDNQHRLITYEEMFKGSIRSAAVYPREIVKKALSCNAAAIIVAHNHPSGVLVASEEDRKVTKNIIKACQLVDIKVIDHFIIGNGGYLSFFEQGIIRL